MKARGGRIEAGAYFMSVAGAYEVKAAGSIKVGVKMACVGERVSCSQYNGH
jgi:hypothetical protein